MKYFKIVIILLLDAVLLVSLGGCIDNEVSYDGYGTKVIYRAEGHASEYTYKLNRSEMENGIDLFGFHIGPYERSYTYLFPDGTLSDVMFESENDDDYGLKQVETENLEYNLEYEPKLSDLRYWMYQLKDENVDSVANDICEVGEVLKVDDIYYCLIRYADQTSFLLEVAYDGTVKSLIRLNMRTTSFALCEKE